MAVSFLGANSPEGFFSYYGDLQDDPSNRMLYIIKGGSGCGKSTFMKRLSRQAQKNGWETEEILCSSDPESLDALRIPALGLAFVDGTAPHITEPRLCGVRARYLDFSQFYRADLRAQEDTLHACWEKKQACYPRATALLHAAAQLEHECSEIVQPYCAALDLSAFASQMLKAESLSGSGHTQVRRRFFCALTPSGMQYCFQNHDAAYNRVYVLRDSYHLSQGVLQSLLPQLGAACGTAFLGFSPMQPQGGPEQLLLPQKRIAFVRSTTDFPYRGQAHSVLDLDAALHADLPEQARRRLAFLTCTVRALQAEAIRYLYEAKQYHDEIEAICRDCVDFPAIDRLTEEFCVRIDEKEIFAH